MKKIVVPVILCITIFFSCTTVQKTEESVAASIPEGAPESAVPENGEPVYETISVPLVARETICFGDGDVDRYTLTTYVQESSRIERVETFSSYDELLESSAYEYDGELPVRIRLYGPDSKLKSYQVLRYSGDALLMSEEYYNARDDLQTVSSYEYDGNGRKTRWTVYGGGKNILSYTEYHYDSHGRLSEIRVCAPDGEVEDMFAYEYAAGGLTPVKKVQYAAEGAVVQVIATTLENGLITVNEVLTPDGKVDFRYEYTYGDYGECVRETIFDRSGNVIEYREMEYVMINETQIKHK